MIKLKPGDIIEVVWLDHFRYQGDDLITPLEVKSWGIFEQATEDGIAIIQNEVQAGEAHGVDRCMDGQFILRPVIQSITVLRKRGVAGVDGLTQSG